MRSSHLWRWRPTLLLQGRLCNLASTVSEGKRFHISTSLIPLKDPTSFFATVPRLLWVLWQPPTKVGVGSCPTASSSLFYSSIFPSPAELSYFINIPVRLFAALKSGAASCGLCLHSNGAVNRSQQQQPQLAAAAAAYSQIYSKTAEFHIRVAHRGFPVSCFTTPFPHFKILIFSVDLEMPLWSLTASTS